MDRWEESSMPAQGLLWRSSPVVGVSSKRAEQENPHWPFDFSEIMA
jgi:hypothetical protein